MDAMLMILPVRRGMPGGVGGLTDVIGSPAHATAVGLVLYGAEHRSQRKFKRVTEANLFNKVVVRMREWFGEFFY